MDELSSGAEGLNSLQSPVSTRKFNISISVYDLLPPNGLSTVLWTFGCSLLHTGVVIEDKEYAYGGHDRPGVSGVYWTHPKTEPPGGTFRCELQHGFTILRDAEINSILEEAAQYFQGRSYNLLSKNCNHFTSYLCEQLTGKPAPAWINRAASVAMALPCVVPRQLGVPPDHDTADGARVNEDDERDERSAMLKGVERRVAVEFNADEELTGRTDTNGEHIPFISYSPRDPATVTDTSGRELPVSERAPMLQS